MFRPYTGRIQLYRPQLIYRFPNEMFQENNYEAWYRDLLSMNSDWKTRKLFRLMWYAHQVEQLERDSETETAKQLRNRFVNEVTQKKQSK